MSDETGLSVFVIDIGGDFSISNDEFCAGMESFTLTGVSALATGGAIGLWSLADGQLPVVEGTALIFMSLGSIFAGIGYIGGRIGDCGG